MAGVSVLHGEPLGKSPTPAEPGAQLVLSAHERGHSTCAWEPSNCSRGPRCCLRAFAPPCSLASFCLAPLRCPLLGRVFSEGMFRMPPPSPLSSLLPVSFFLRLGGSWSVLHAVSTGPKARRYVLFPAVSLLPGVGLAHGGTDLAWAWGTWGSSCWWEGPLHPP